MRLDWCVFIEFITSFSNWKWQELSRWWSFLLLTWRQISDWSTRLIGSIGFYLDFIVSKKNTWPFFCQNQSFELLDGAGGGAGAGRVCLELCIRVLISLSHCWRKSAHYQLSIYSASLKDPTIQKWRKFILRF